MPEHYNDVIMSVMASQITSLTIVYSTVYSGADQWKHQRSASLAFVRGIPRWPVNSPHKGPVTRKMFPFDDVIMAGLAVGFHSIASTIDLGRIQTRDDHINGHVNSPVTGEFPLQRLVTRNFDIFFHLGLNKRMRKSIETPVMWDAIALIMTSP